VYPEKYRSKLSQWRMGFDGISFFFVCTDNDEDENHHEQHIYRTPFRGEVHFESLAQKTFLEKNSFLSFKFSKNIRVCNFSNQFLRAVEPLGFSFLFFSFSLGLEESKILFKSSNYSFSFGVKLSLFSN
jgi:hypothetical protein